MEFLLGAFSTEWEQRKAAFLHDLSLGRRPFLDDEERRRRGGSAAISHLSGGSKARGSAFWVGGREGPGVAARHRRADRPMRARFAGLVSGGQPAVVKMASFGGGSRLGAMINYVSRNGAVVVENQRGDRLRGRDQLLAVAGEWDHLMKNRAESRDIGRFKISVADGGRDGEDVFERARQIAKQALGDRAFAFAVTERFDGSGLDIDGVTVLRSRNGERLTADAKATAIAQQRLDDGQSSDSSGSFRFAGYGNGTDYGTSRLRSLVETHKGNVQDEQGRTIADAKQAGDLVQLEWRDQLHSRKPRDVMHLILSARAGTDAAAFQDAARDFLGVQFAGYRYVFSLHDASSDPKAEETGGKRPHVHVHAIIAMRSDAGDRVETTISTFRQWRLTMAEKARRHGIDMEMTDRRDRASPAAYSKNQVRPVNTIGRTRHAGTSDAGQRRYDAKRDDARSLAATARSQSYMQAAHTEWHKIQDSQRSQPELAFVKAQVLRLDDRVRPTELSLAAQGEKSDFGSQFRTHLVKLSELVSEGDDMRHMTRPEFEAYEKRVETALFQAERTMPPEDRKDFEAIATAAREHVNVRRELVDLLEERAAAETSDPRISVPAGDDRHDEKQRWNNAVERHGFAAADAANKALLDIERAREAMERTAGKDQSSDQLRALKQELDTQLAKAAELGISGNGVIREAAEVDDELKSVLQTAEHERQKAEREKSATSVQSEARSGQQRGTATGASERDPEVGKHNEAGERYADFEKRVGDTPRGDPAKQHVPRLEELQREADERNERERDDRER